MAFVLIGVVAGFVAALPVLLAFRSPSRELSGGMGAVLASFIILSAAILAVRMLARGSTLAFGTAATLCFILATCLVAALHKA